MKSLLKFLRTTSLWILLLPYCIGGLGAASNQAVLIANHDKFPVMINDWKTAHADVSPEGMLDPVHCVMTKDTHLNWLADIFDFHTYIMSIGDMLLDLGQWLSGFCSIVWGVLVIRKLLDGKQN